MKIANLGKLHQQFVLSILQAVMSNMEHETTSRKSAHSLPSFESRGIPSKKEEMYVDEDVTRAALSQFKSLGIRRSIFPNYMTFVDPRI